MEKPTIRKMTRREKIKKYNLVSSEIPLEDRGILTFALSKSHQSVLDEQSRRCGFYWDEVLRRLVKGYLDGSISIKGAS